MQFYLGTHMPNWLESAGVPLFVSRRRLFKRRTFPRATIGWALDSGGFSELSMNGSWSTTAKTYAAEVRRFSSDIGGMEWAAIQDWMCEPDVRAKTGKTVAEHQEATVRSLLDLQAEAPEIHWAPVLQGWEPDDYLRHVDLYEQAGVRLVGFKAVGFGSVCRRQEVGHLIDVIRRLAYELPIHCFGFKFTGLPRVADVVASSDSMAWSAQARKVDRLPGHEHMNCANCLPFALRWRAEMLTRLERQSKAQQAQRRLFA